MPTPIQPATFQPVQPRVLGRVHGASLGPTLVCVGGMHGNEPAGVRGLERVLARLGADPAGLRGQMVGLVGNRRALAQGRRYLARDLNRMWTPEEVHRQRAHPRGEPAEAMDPAADPDAAEQRELDLELRRMLLGALPGKAFLLDLHTTSAPGPPFVVLDDALANRAFALEIPVPIVLGLEEELPGTLLYYLAGEGVVTLGFEAGQNDDPDSADRAEAAVWLALEASGVLARGMRPEVAAARRLLAEESRAYSHVVEVLYRHAIQPEDGFRMDPGFLSFQPVRAGERLATDRHGEVTASLEGLLLMPLYQEQGSDGFFLARPVEPRWLHLSAALRRLRLVRYLHWLPGVHRDADHPDTYLVDRRIARFMVRELFHLLGFRREGEREGKVVLKRRAHE
jgi:predicted deacylase